MNNIEEITDAQEFYITGAYAQGIIVNGKKILVLTQIEEDTFCNGEECNDRILKEYGL